MNYHIYHDSNQFEFTFNFVNTVGDLQTVILQALNIPKSNLLFLMYNDKILGKDYPFTDNLVDKELFDISIFVVPDYYQAGEGTKVAYDQWLHAQISSTDLITANQQLLFYNTNNNLATPNLNFFTESNVTTSVPASQRPRPTSTQQPTINNSQDSAPVRMNDQGIVPQEGSMLQTLLNRGRGRGQNASQAGRRAQASRGAQRGRGGFLGNSGGMSRPTINTFGSGNEQLQSILQNFLTGDHQSGSSSSSISNIFDTMINNNIFGLAVTMTEGPEGSNIGLVATGAVGGSGYSNSDFFQRLLSDLEPVPVTLTRESVNQLPIFKFSELPTEIKESNTCSICLDDFADDDEIRVLLCKHYFHKDCIDRWLTQENVRCPLCRHDIRDRCPGQDMGAGSPNEDTSDHDDSSISSDNLETEMEYLLDDILEEQIEELERELRQ
jgi:hypothetical protein